MSQNLIFPTFLQYIDTFLRKCHTKKEKFIINQAFKLKVDAVQTDDGQIRIRKALLPFGCPN